MIIPWNLYFFDWLIGLPWALRMRWRRMESILPRSSRVFLCIESLRPSWIDSRYVELISTYLSGWGRFTDENFELDLGSTLLQSSVGSYNEDVEWFRTGWDWVWRTMDPSDRRSRNRPSTRSRRWVAGNGIYNRSSCYEWRSHPMLLIHFCSPYILKTL